jgi:hypothetical protein
MLGLRASVLLCTEIFSTEALRPAETSRKITILRSGTATAATVRVHVDAEP